MTFNEIEKEFDEKYPPFTGVGASFPMFKNTPNRNHIKSFLKQSFIKYLQSEVERLKPYVSDGDPWNSGYRAALDDQITHLQAQINSINNNE